MRGLKRALPYGFSIYEMNVYGISASIGPNDLLGIDFSLPEAMDEDPTIPLHPTAYSRSGAIIPTPEIVWSADKPAAFTVDTFTPHSYGTYTITVTTSGGQTSSATIFVYESRKLVSLCLSSDEVELVEGDIADLAIEGYDRFGCTFAIDIARLAVSVLDEEGHPVSGLSYDAGKVVVRGDRCGTYTLELDYNGVRARATVRVRTFAETNLALGCPARSSGDEGDNRPGYATDGNLGIRWASAWEENQWIVVDLERGYVIDSMVLVWESAFARDYHIDASLDGTEWTRVFTATDTQGGTESITLDAPTPARYVRLTGDRRALDAYGISLLELEVYGTGRYQLPDEGPTGVGSIPAAEAPSLVFWYNLDGRLIAAPPHRFRHLYPPPGH